MRPFWRIRDEALIWLSGGLWLFILVPLLLYVLYALVALAFGLT